MLKIKLLTVLMLFGIIFAKDIRYVGELATGVKGDKFGAKVVFIGDVNGDKFDDMLVCAEGSYTTQEYPGKVYLYLGSKSLPKEPSLELSGEASGDHFGVSATALGDINGDGFDDFAIGADKNDEAGTDAGKVYIYYGGKDLDSEPDIVLTGNRANDWFGASIGGGHDLNGDAKLDVLIGAPYAGRKYSGSVYLYLGGDDFSKPALTLTGEDSGDSYGYEISSLGDVTGDSIGDFAVSAVYADVSQITDAGIVYIYSGGSVISKKETAILKGRVSREQMGFRVLSPGDFTGDGIDDILIGAPGGGSGGIGAAYIFAGGSIIRTEPLKIFYGTHKNSMFGMGVSSAGDFTGDGITDIMVGAPYTDAGNYHTGRVEFYRGGKTSNIDETYHLNGAKEEDQCGFCLAYIPDFFGANDPLFAITWVGPGSGNLGISKVMIYRK